MKPLQFGVRPLALCLLVWGFGLVVEAQLGLSVPLWVGLFGAGVGWFVYRGCGRRLGWSLGLVLCWFALGGLWYAQDRREREASMGPALGLWASHHVWLEGWVVGKVLRQNRQPVVQRMRFRLVRGNRALFLSGGAERWSKLRGHIWLKVRGGRQLFRGDGLRVRVRLRRPRMYANPGGFDSYQYWRRRGIRWHASVRGSEVVRLRRRSGEVIQRLEVWRSALLRWIEVQVQEPEVSALLCALLLGEKGGISPAVRQSFAQTGTAHMLAISGLHLAIVCSLLWLGLRWLLGCSTFLLVRGWHSQLAVMLLLPGALLYVLLSGGAISTQRAFVMMTVLFVGRLLRRNNDALTALLLAAFLLLMWQPYAMFSLSFQLSFGAVIALIWGHRIGSNEADSVESWQRVPLHRFGHWVRVSMWASAVATLATLPITLEYFPQVPLWGPVVNLVAVPLGGYLVVGTGLLSVSAWFVLPACADALLGVAGQCAQWLLRWVSWCAHWPGSQLTLSPLCFHEWILYYALLCAVLCWRRFRRFSAALLCGAAMVAVFSWGFPKLVLAPTMEVHFLDVGQGDSMLIRFPNGKVMMVDAGGSAFGQWDIGERVLLPLLRRLRISHIDYAVLSHPHPDHYDGFVSVFRHLSIGEFWHTTLASRRLRFQALREQLKRRKIRQRVWTPRHRSLWVGEVKVEVFHPFPRRYEGDRYYWVLHANDNSLVLRLTWQKVSILLTGDIEQRAEQILLERWPNLRADVLKVPHHGSRTSSTAAFLDRVRPKHALFGVGRDNMFGFPHASVLRRYKERGVKVWRTDRHGRILLRTDGVRLQWESYLRSTTD